MKSILLFALLLTGIQPGISAPSTNDIAGNWLGTLEIAQTKLHIQFKISKVPEGGYTAKMDSLDQGAIDLPVQHATFKDNTLRLDVKFIEGVYEGKLDPANNKVTGVWRQDGQNTPLVLNRSATVATPASLAATAADLAASKEAAEKLKGVWNGTLSSADATFRLLLNFTNIPSGAASGTMDSPDQGLKGIPLSAITYKDGKVRFEARGLTAFYEGVSFNETTSMTGQWHQAGQTLPLNFRKTPTKASSP